jgi:Uma2 family endonuclease
VSAETSQHLLTVEEFFQLPDAIHGGRMELIRGEVFTHLPNGGVHGQVAGAVNAALQAYNRGHHFGCAGVAIGFILQREPDIVLAPDAAFVSRERLPAGVLPPTFVEGPPTLAVEVVSPNDLDSEVTAKVQLYVKLGVERIWVVRPESTTVTVHRPDGTARVCQLSDSLTSDDAGFATEGFVLPLTDIFE